MKILQINGYESPGKRFNGLAITPLLKKYNIESKYFAWIKDTENEDVITIENIWLRLQNHLLTVVEFAAAKQSALYNNARKIIALPEFQEADLIHLHIIHSGFFSIGDLPLLTSLKPTVWTLHDPWALTGHCIHPYDCDRWKIGCGQCPNLDTTKKILWDNTANLYKYKKKAYDNSQMELIVASRFMEKIVQESQIFPSDIILNYLPFGIDLNFFNPKVNPIDSGFVHMRTAINVREVLGIPNDAFVICFRSDYNEFKGVDYILTALKRLDNFDKNIWIITIGRRILQEELTNEYNVCNLGWVNESLILRNALLACDIFLMPSLAESFGVMAVEAMACGKPVIVFEGTALPDVVGAPDVGISIPRDADVLSKTIEHLKNNKEERLKRGKASRVYAEKHYDVNTHVKRLVDIYERVVYKSVK